MVKRFLASRRTGFYFSVLEEGFVQAGDTFDYVEHSKHGISVVDITRFYAFEKDDWATIRRVVELETLSEDWRGYFQHRLDKSGQAST
jgi:MOSC domain-containing protein YiiM